MQGSAETPSSHSKMMTIEMEEKEHHGSLYSSNLESPEKFMMFAPQT
jgi:hypothetical protein